MMEIVPVGRSHWPLGCGNKGKRLESQNLEAWKGALWSGNSDSCGRGPVPMVPGKLVGTKRHCWVRSLCQGDANSNGKTSWKCLLFSGSPLEKQNCHFRVLSTVSQSRVQKGKFGAEGQ